MEYLSISTSLDLQYCYYAQNSGNVFGISLFGTLTPLWITCAVSAPFLWLPSDTDNGIGGGHNRHDQALTFYANRSFSVWKVFLLLKLIFIRIKCSEGLPGSNQRYVLHRLDTKTLGLAAARFILFWNSISFPRNNTRPTRSNRPIRLPYISKQSKDQK